MSQEDKKGGQEGPHDHHYHRQTSMRTRQAGRRERRGAVLEVSHGADEGITDKQQSNQHAKRGDRKVPARPANVISALTKEGPAQNSKQRNIHYTSDYTREHAYELEGQSIDRELLSVGQAGRDDEQKKQADTTRRQQKGRQGRVEACGDMIAKIKDITRIDYPVGGVRIPREDCSITHTHKQQ